MAVGDAPTPSVSLISSAVRSRSFGNISRAVDNTPSAVVLRYSEEDGLEEAMPQEVRVKPRAKEEEIMELFDV